MDVLSINTEKFEDSPPQSPAYEELVEDITHAVARLNINWLAERREAHHKIKVD